MTRACSLRPGSLLLALALVLASGCGDDGATTDTTTTTNATATMTATMSAGTTTNTTDDTPTTTAGTDSATGNTSDTGDGGGFCVHQCGADADCLVDGDDLGLTCQDNFCTGESSGCTGDAECIALFSGWTSACTSGGGECDQLGQICVQVEGGGACATPPSDFFMCEAVPGWAEIQVNDIDGSPVTVCGNPNAECTDENFCLVPCKSDADCTTPAYPICDTNTGVCGCGSDDHCATIGMPHLSVCNAGACGCGSDQQCVDGNAGDVCNQGACGCSGDAVCANVENSFDGGMIACVSL